MQIIESQSELNRLYQEIGGRMGEPAATRIPVGSKSMLSDAEVLEKALSSKNGFLFADLYEGRWQERYPSQSEAESALCFILAFWTGRNAEQIDRIFRDSALFREKWDERHGAGTYGDLTIRKAIEIQTTVYDPEYKNARALSDMGNSIRFARMFKETLRWCPEIGWLLYKEGRWARDETNQILLMAEECVRAIYCEAAAATDKDERKAILRHAQQSESLQKRKSMIEGAAPRLAVRAEELDADPWVLNVLNGSIDLRTGKISQHDPAQLLTKIAPVVFDPNADRQRFDRFLVEIFPDEDRFGIGNIQVIHFVKKFLGYCLTGSCSEQIMAVAWGGGANGKSTLLGVIQEMLGDYATTTPAETLLAKKGDAGIPNDIARLRGMRLVIASETAEGRRMNTALIKQLTGQDQLTARFLRKEFFTFSPQFKLVLVTNHKPAANGDDAAFWRRVRLIPFTEKFEGAARDNYLAEQLRDEWAGILGWMVEGCLLWQREGLNPPAEIKQATDEYRNENDLIADWISDRCEVRTGAVFKTAVLFLDFRNWLMQNGERTFFTQTKFTQLLTARGFTYKKDGYGQRVLLGIDLKPAATDDFSTA